MCAQQNHELQSYIYRELESPRHIRLLKVTKRDGNGTSTEPEYDVIHANLDEWRKRFETVSYTWGDPVRVSNLHLVSGGHIGLTANLSQALPHLTRRSETQFLWIDQLCINQNDTPERGVQVGMMDQIYAAGKTVLIWLGPGDEHSRLVQQWRSALADYIARGPLAAVLTPGTPSFRPDTRDLFVRNSFAHPETDGRFAPAIHHFLHRPWFSRGWVVQELLLSETAVFLAGGEAELSLQDLRDLVAVPAALMPEELRDGTEGCYQLLLSLKLHRHEDEGEEEDRALAFLKLMALVSAEFSTFELRDRAFAFLGMSGLTTTTTTLFRPDYECLVRDAFAKFALALALAYGSLDFLSLCSTWQDGLMAGTPEALKGLPSWVPSWTAVPLSAPFRLATGGVRVLRHRVAWDAAGGRRHGFGDGELEAAASSGRLRVRGRIVDRVGAVCGGAVFDRYWDDATDAYLDGLAAAVKSELGEGFPRLDRWSKTEMVDFLNLVAWNGVRPEKTAEVMLRREPLVLTGTGEEDRWNMPDQSLGLCLSIGRGRRFMRSDGGRLGIVPRLGTEASSKGNHDGSVIALVHGCRVPLVLQPSEGEDSAYRLVGDCFVEGLMYGDAVNWAEEDADVFTLV